MLQMQPVLNEWWTASQAGYVGGAVGVMGAMFGTVLGGCSFLVHQGRARGFMLGGYALMATVGIVSLLGAVVAAVSKQPWHVLQPLLIAGPLFTFLGLMLGNVVRKQYRLAEERKVDAAQIRGG
jgi:hypothetical protein